MYKIIELGNMWEFATNYFDFSFVFITLHQFLKLIMPSLIKTEGLTFSFAKGVKTLDDVNLDVPQGSIYGFLGPNGAGKTTTLRLLLGLLRNQQGKIGIFEKDF